MVERRANQRRPDLLRGGPVTRPHGQCRGNCFQQKWRFQVGEWNFPIFKNHWWFQKLKTHPTSQAKPSCGPQLAQSLPVCDLGCRIFQHSTHFLTAELPSRFLSSVVFLPRLPCLLRSATLGVIISLLLHPESGPQTKAMFYLCFLPTIHPLVLVQP